MTPSGNNFQEWRPPRQIPGTHHWVNEGLRIAFDNIYSLRGMMNNINAAPKSLSIQEIQQGLQIGGKAPLLIEGLPGTPSGAANASTTITTTLPLKGGGSIGSNLVLSVSVFTGDSGNGGASGIVPAPPAGSANNNEFLSANGSFAPIPGLNVVSPPAHNGSNGVAGQVAYDGNYWYWCFAANNWSRVAGIAVF